MMPQLGCQGGNGTYLEIHYPKIHAPFLYRPDDRPTAPAQLGR